MIRLKQVIESAKARLKEMYHGQPTVIVVQPLRFHEHSLPTFELKGVLLESWKRKRKICQDGKGLYHINIPCNWADLFTEPLQLHLVQTDKKVLIIEEMEVKP